jgi:cell division protein ZapE
MVQSVRQRYERMAAAGEVVPDTRQRLLADALDQLRVRLAEGPRRSKKSALGRLLARPPTDGPAPGLSPAQGLYIWGGVGGGKTLLMDIFYEAALTAKKRRLHFHAFMADIHERLDARRRDEIAGGAKASDPLVAVAAAVASEIDLLCFDEFMVVDIADAMILGRLFENLFARGLVIVATSNIPPSELYRDGLNRSLFLPFIAMIEQRLGIFHLDAPRDYRLTAEDDGRRYIMPLGGAATAAMDAHFRRLAGAEGEQREIAHKGRRIVVPQAADGVARFAFSDLCARPLAAGDYRRIVSLFRTLLIDDVPILDDRRRNEAKRMIVLIDVLYDGKTRLIVSAEAEPHALWVGEDTSISMEFARTASRLMEMRSDAWWEAAPSAAKTKKARAI